MPVFSIDPAVFDAFANARFAAVVLRGSDKRTSNAEIAALLDEATDRVRQRFSGIDPKSDPAIAVWREAFGARGWTPSKYLSSIEALVRRVAKGDALPRINPAVDLANAVSLTHLVPIGAHDLGTAPNGLTVRLSRDGDSFRPMGDAPDEAPEPGEIVYAHGDDVRTRRWVWRQSRTGLVTTDSTEILFPIDGFAGRTDGAIRASAAMLLESAPRLLGGSAQIFYLDPQHPATE